MTGPSCDFCENVLLRICQFWGLTTALGLWGVGVEAVYYHYDLGFYLVPLAVIITFLETVFLLNYCVEVCVSPPSVCKSVWRGVLWLDDWRKGLLYVLLAIPCFLSPKTVLLGVVSGAMLAVTGLFYCVKTCKTRQTQKTVELYTRNYDRFDEEIQDDFDEDIMNPTANVTVTSVADQIEILEV